MRRLARSPSVRALSLGAALSVLAPTVAAAAPAFEQARAQTLYDQGIERFDAGDFEGALEKLDASIAVERSTSALYAKAQSLNKLERCREAVPIYNEVLSKLPEESAARPAVKDALVVCAEKLAQAEELVVAPAIEAEPVAVEEPSDEGEQPPTKPRKRWYTDPYAPVFIGVGAVGVGVGGYFLSQASKEDARQPEQYDEFAAKGERVRKLQIRGGVILGIGGALVLTGVIRYAVLGVRDRRARTAAFAPVWGHRWAGVSISGRF